MLSLVVVFSALTHLCILSCNLCGLGIDLVCMEKCAVLGGGCPLNVGTAGTCDFVVIFFYVRGELAKGNQSERKAYQEHQSLYTGGIAEERRGVLVKKTSLCLS